MFITKSSTILHAIDLSKKIHHNDYYELIFQKYQFEHADFLFFQIFPIYGAVYESFLLTNYGHLLTKLEF